MIVRYRMSFRIAIWILFLGYLLLMFEEGFSLSMLLPFLIFTAGFWSVFVNRYFAVNSETLWNGLANYSFDLRDGGFVRLEEKKIFVVRNQKKQWTQIITCLIHPKDWQAFTAWVEETQPADAQDYPQILTPLGKLWKPVEDFCIRYAKPIKGILALGAIWGIAWWGEGVWERHREIQRLFARVETAMDNENWREARDAVTELQNLVPEDERAIDLLIVANDQLRPRLALRATWNGEEVAATVRIEGVGECDTYALPETIPFYNGAGRSYMLFVNVVEDGQWLQAPPLNLVTDWEGFRELEVAVEPYAGPVPVPGGDWRSSATGMEFVWVEDLEMAIGKYEVTNGEYRMMNPDHDSGAVEGHSLNGDRQPVVLVSFRDAVAFAQWMTRREYEAGTLPYGYRYRLPSIREFGTLLGVNGQVRPWGNQWPPPTDIAVNYSGEESPLAEKSVGYRDAFAVSAPVDDLWVNPSGLAGVGGNVWEVASWHGKDVEFRYWHGEAWTTGKNADPARPEYQIAISSLGEGVYPMQKNLDGGFRLVLSR